MGYRVHDDSGSGHTGAGVWVKERGRRGGGF
jgi:hypothetical protein